VPVRSSYRIYAELDVASFERGGALNAENPKLFQYLEWREQDVTRATSLGDMNE
jgi:hypothetical protein